VRISLLGPLLVEGESGPIALGAAKERSLLAALALTSGSVVSSDSLIAALWGESPPPAARKTLQTYVWNLRRALGAETISTQAPGYRLGLDATAVVVHRFRALVRVGETAMRDEAVPRARAALGEALDLWRGEPFAGVAQHTGLASEAVRLNQEYLSALDSRVAADLADGRHAEVVSELEALVCEHPFREKLWCYLMVALYRSGRQADALAAYQRVRTVLAEELGLEPGGELRRLETAVLDHDPELSGPPLVAGGLWTAVIRSPVHYARSTDGVSVAYQVAGDGPIDILAIPGFVSHLDIWWNAPTDRLVRRLTSMGRLIAFDKRGMGLSDRPDQIHAEQWVDDALAVLDAVESKRAVILGVSAGTPTALLLASRFPERVRALVLHGGFARTLEDTDYEIGFERELVESFAAELEAGWGSGVHIELYAPSRASDPCVREYWARYQQLSASPPAAMRYLWAALETDVRSALPSIRVPTLVVHAERDVVVPLAQARYMAERIPGAEIVVLDSDVHLICVSDVIEELADVIEAFVGRVICPGTPAS
jgi:DNA-binding SARP family transcriptional activator/pimeloyl-ACP methyl ester carboxylesterase